MSYVQTDKNQNIIENKKIITNVIEVPAADETCRFASCFTSMYMCIEEPSDTLPEATKRHNQLYNFFQFVSGGVHGTPNSACRNSYEYAMEYSGYDENANVIYGFDGMFSYWKDIDNDMTIKKDGYLDNKMFYLRDWFEIVDFILVIICKTEPKINNKDVLTQLIDFIEKENIIYRKNIIDIMDENAVNMNESELLILFNDCMGMIYQQMDTRHKLHCTFKESLFPNMQNVGTEILEAADIFIDVHRLGTELFGVLGECWSVFMNPVEYLKEFKKPVSRQKMSEVLEQIVDTNLKACRKIEEIILKI